MTVLTIFSAVKPFTNPLIATIQRNAILSWIQLAPDVEVILIGMENGLVEFADGLNLQVIPSVTRNEKGTPLISSIFNIAHEHARSPMLGYVNADIILTPDIVTATKAVADWRKDFLIIGQRYDLRLRDELDFSPGWINNLRLLVEKQGRTHPPRGSDYFIFPRNCFLEIPDFAVGRVGWDNWIIYKAWQDRLAIVDATRSVFIVHQDHDYSHLTNKGVSDNSPEANANMILAGGKMNTNFTILDANYYLDNNDIKSSKWILGRILRKLELFISRNNYPKNKFLVFLYQKIYRWRINTQKARELKDLVKRNGID